MEYIICRVCGYIETADKKDDVCPACGFPKTVWMEYKPRKLNDTRYKLLDLHVHPIFVHFPIVFTALAAALPVIAYITEASPSIANMMPMNFAERLFDFATMLCWFLPLMVIVGGITGYVGGILRYKSKKAPILKTKIIVTAVYFILSCVLFYISVTSGIHSNNAFLVFFVAAAASVCAGYLGKLGSYLFATKFGPYVAG